MIDFTKLMLWVKAQPEEVTWPVRNPYACPVASYMQQELGEPWCAVYQHGFNAANAGLHVFAPQSLLRRLIVRIDRRSAQSITRDQVLVLGRSIARLEQFTEQQILEQEHAAFLLKRKEQQKEWGW